MNSFGEFLSAFADLNKRKILFFLAGRIKATANEITLHLATSQPNASMHLSKLRHWKLITFQKHGVYKTFMLTKRGYEYTKLIQELEFGFHRITDNVEEFLIHTKENESFDEPMRGDITKRRF